MATDGTPTYSYFTIRGLQFPTRLMLAYTGEEHTAKTFDVVTFAQHKGTTINEIREKLIASESTKEGGEWIEKKNELGLNFPTLPSLTFPSGFAFNQTSAIARYLARKYGLEAETEEDKCRQDMFMGVYTDMWLRFRNIVAFATPEKAAEVQAMYKKMMLPKQVQQLTAFLGNNKFACGNKVTMADFFLFDLLEMFQRFSPEAIPDKAKAYVERMLALPAVKKLYEEHPEYVFPMFPGFCTWGN